MNPNDPDSRGPGDQAEVSVQAAEPYRAPNSVPDERKRRGLFGSPIIWGLATCVVLAAVGLAYSRQSTQKNVINYVEDFGIERRGPVEPLEEIEEYEAIMSADTVPP